MKKVQFGIWILFVLLMLFSSITFAFTWGSGKLATERRTVPVFHSVELSGSGHVYLKQGNEQSLEVITDNNLLKMLNTDVFNGKLKIGFDHGVSRVTKLDIYITLKELKGLTISGSGDIQGNGSFETSDLKLRISGSGEISLEVNAKNIISNISGSGDIELAGRADEQEIDISGSGNFNGYDLLTQKAAVVIKGSGNCRINVAQDLSIELYGSGNVEYKGRPEVNIKSSGSGKIRSIK